MTKYQEVSIHAPARGATTGELPSLPCYGVSIHAPARGATYIPGMVLQLFDVSIHAPARGATIAPAPAAANSMPFQSTHPHGVRPAHNTTVMVAPERFNPRTRTGCDDRLL